VGGISKSPKTRPSYFFKVIACSEFQGYASSLAWDIDTLKEKATNCHAPFRPFVGGIFKNPWKRVKYFLPKIDRTEFQVPIYSRFWDIEISFLDATPLFTYLWAEIPKILKHVLDIFLRWLHVPTSEVLPSSVPEILSFLNKIALTATPTCGRNFQKSWNASLIFF